MRDRVMSEATVHPPKEHVNQLPRVEQLTWQNATVESKNYPSLLTAMGQEQYHAYQFGAQGLRGEVPTDIASSLSESKIPNARYSYSEYDTRGEHKRHLFLTKSLPNSTECIFTIDVDQSVPFAYRLDHLYLKDRQGNVVDFLEEAQAGAIESYYAPVANSFFNPGTHQLFFGDLDMISKMHGVAANIAIYAHEIGHYKDWLGVNPDIFFRFVTDLAADIGTARAVSIFEKFFGSIRSTSHPFVQEVVRQVERGARIILALEENASNFARLFIVNKRNEGIDLVPDEPGGDFAQILDYAFTTYELQLMGKSQSIVSGGRILPPGKFGAHDALRELKSFVQMYRVMARRTNMTIPPLRKMAAETIRRELSRFIGKKRSEEASS